MIHQELYFRLIIHSHQSPTCWFSLILHELDLSSALWKQCTQPVPIFSTSYHGYCIRSLSRPSDLVIWIRTAWQHSSRKACSSFKQPDNFLRPLWPHKISSTVQISPEVIVKACFNHPLGCHDDPAGMAPGEDWLWSRGLLNSEIWLFGCKNLGGTISDHDQLWDHPTIVDHKINCAVSPNNHTAE